VLEHSIGVKRRDRAATHGSNREAQCGFERGVPSWIGKPSVGPAHPGLVEPACLADSAILGVEPLAG
jgi:hypothetical protein